MSKVCSSGSFSVELKSLPTKEDLNKRELPLCWPNGVWPREWVRECQCKLRSSVFNYSLLILFEIL